MAYNRVFWENGSLRRDGYAVIDGETYPVVQPEYEGNTPINEENLNKMDKGIFDNAYNILAVDTASGNIKIGRIGIEWGTVSVAPTSGSSPNYYGSTSVTFENTYAYTPCMLANLGAGFQSVTNVATINVSTTGGSVWMTASATTARTCRYLVIGVLPE